MKPITPTARLPSARRPHGSAPTMSPEGAFGVPTTTGAVGATEAALVGPAPSLAGLLGAQEVGVVTPRDHAARRHGQRALKLLHDLHLSLIAGADGRNTVLALVALTNAMPEPDDPVLVDALRAISVRAAVEAARLEPETAASRRR